MRTIEIDMQPSMILSLEEQAKAEGKTTSLLIVSILDEYLSKKISNTNSVSDRLKKLRGSLSSINSLDLSSDDRAQKILEK